MTLAEVQERPGQESFGLEKFRKALMVIGQETRFTIFCLIAEHPGCLTLEDICDRMGGSKERYYHQVYQLLQCQAVTAVTDSSGRKFLAPSEPFLSFGLEFFKNYGSKQAVGQFAYA